MLPLVLEIVTPSPLQHQSISKHANLADSQDHADFSAPILSYLSTWVIMIIKAHLSATERF